MKKLIAITLATAALVLSGCASVPMGDPQRDAALKTFKVAPDKAGIYIYRNETMGAAVKMDVAVDGKPLGQTAAKTYLYKDVAPGKHTVTSTAENSDTVEVDVKPGTVAYIWQEVKIGFGSARTKLNLMSEADGRKGVLESSLAAGQ